MSIMYIWYNTGLFWSLQNKMKEEVSSFRLCCSTDLQMNIDLDKYASWLNRFLLAYIYILKGKHHDIIH